MSVDHYPLDSRVLAHQPTEPGRPFCEIHLDGSSPQCCPCGQWVAVQAPNKWLWFPLMGPPVVLLWWERHEMDYGRKFSVGAAVYERAERRMARRQCVYRARPCCPDQNCSDMARAAIRRDLLALYGEIEDAAGVEWALGVGGDLNPGTEQSEGAGESYQNRRAGFIRTAAELGAMSHYQSHYQSQAPRRDGGRLCRLVGWAIAHAGVPDLPVSDHGIEGAIPLPPEDPHGEPGPYLPWHEQNRRINELLCRRNP